MFEHEIAFLLRLLNQQFSDGHVDDNHHMVFMQGTILARLLNLGFVADFHPNLKRWYVHINDGTGHWEK